MATDTELGNLLVQQNLMSEAQLKTALDFQKSLGGDLRNIVVKLGYVKDSILAGLVAQEEHVDASVDITADAIDFEMVKSITKDTLQKHQVLPLRSSNPHVLVLAMADPNDLRVIEEIQFLVNRSVEPAVTTKNTIRKALNQLHELEKQAKERGSSDTTGKPPKRRAVSGERLKAIRSTPVDKLIRAYLVLQIEKGELSLEDLLSRANKL